MREAINALDEKSIRFSIEQYPDGSWSAESVNIDGILTGGTDPRDLPDAMKDAIFTYFEIPPQYCDDTLLRPDNEPAKVRQRMHIGA